MRDACLSYHYCFEEDFHRVDLAILSQCAALSRSQLRRRLVSLRINSQPAKISQPVKKGDHVTMLLRPVIQPRVIAAPVAFSVLWKERDVLVIDKPQGLVVHPGPGHIDDTLVNGLLWQYAECFSIEKEENRRPGIVHRLDAETSGVMIVALTPERHAFLSAQFAERRVTKRYLAIVKGMIRPVQGSVCGNIGRDPLQRQKFCVLRQGGGKDAETLYRVLAESQDYSFVEFTPLTGRTHQIRLHARELGAPILGDALYARRDTRYPQSRMQLHAYALSIVPFEESDEREFIAPLPPHMREQLQVCAFPADAYA